MSANALDRSTVPGPGALRPFRFPEIEHFTLGNGMPVLFARTEGMSLASFRVLVPGGGIREDPLRAGVATLTGATLESGTRGLEGAEIARRLEAQGVRLRVGTSWEVSHVDFTCLADRASGGAEIASALIREPAFPPEEIERLRNEQLAGIMQRRAEPRGLANEMAARYIFARESPFARPLSGTRESVQRLSREDALAFHGATFTPTSGALIVAANLDIDEARRTAEDAFGAWTGAPPPAARATTTPRSESVQVVVVARPGAVQSEIRIGHVGVARNTPDYFPIVVMNTILGGAFSSRLNLNLRERHGFTYGVSSSFVMRRHPGPFVIATAVQTEVTGAAATEILREVDRIREAPVTRSELEDARQYVAGTFPLRLQTTDGIAARLSDLFVYDLPDSYLEEFAQRVLSVGEEEVLDAARRHIHPDRLMVLVVGDPENVVPQMEALGLGSVEVVTGEAEA